MSITSAAAARICACNRSRLGSPRPGIPEHRMTARRPSCLSGSKTSTRIMPRPDGTHGSVRPERRGAVPLSPAWPQNPIRDLAAEGRGTDAAWPGCSTRRRRRARVAGDAFQRRGRGRDTPDERSLPSVDAPSRRTSMSRRRIARRDDATGQRQPRGAEFWSPTRHARTLSGSPGVLGKETSPSRIHSTT